LEFVSGSAAGTNVSLSINGSRIVLTGPAPVVDFETVLRTLTYSHSIVDPGRPQAGLRSFAVVPFDGQQTTTTTVDIVFRLLNNPPRVDLNGVALGFDFEVTFTEEGPAVGVSSGLDLQDSDNESVAFASVRIVEPFDGAGEALALNLTASGLNASDVGLVAVSYDSGQGLLSLVGIARVSIYRALLATVKYVNTLDEPDPRSREVVFSVSDGLLTSIPRRATVRIQMVNDPPRLKFAGQNTT
jgi:hypothetical protein